ncbi:Carboxyl-terminal protease [Clostridium bornimense]|uniref:Carboxyl-terminal protease n=1 Tax=Clostridium bornimense TaxID=1216932 RepID=W6SIL4_9CLOT|nr:S41 family peptidase [Clostridium bornimense]CDM69500.1 Carboxyl-terminal protease [Clostridium bornimense]
MNKKKKIIIVSIVLILTNAATFTGATILSKYLSLKRKDTVVLSKSDYEELKEFNNLFLAKELIEKKYIGDIDEESLTSGAIKGLMDSLDDPYSTYFTKEEYEEFYTLSGKYYGIGVQINANNEGKIRIVNVYDKSPAKSAGLQKEDLIIKVNDEDVDWSSSSKAISMMKGEKGKKVKLTIQREDSIFEANLTTDDVEKNPVTYELIDNEIGYISLEEFDGNSNKYFTNAVEELKNKGAKGFVIDLRGNPGGYLDQVVGIASQFTEKGKLLVYTVDKENKKEEYKSTGGELIGMPMVLLVDGNSASASEVFTGVVKDYKLGTIVGTKTYGKGVCQNTYPIKDGEEGAIKVTTAQYYTPAGNNIHKVGIEPDITVEYPKELLNEEYDKSKDPQFNKAIEEIKNKLK